MMGNVSHGTTIAREPPARQHAINQRAQEMVREARSKARLYYLATPYTLYPGGIDEAARIAAEAAALLLRVGFVAFSPIAHSHAIALAGRLDPLDGEMWLRTDRPFMDACHALIMLRASSWQLSRGMAEEHATFTAAGKPIFYMDPGTVPGDLFL